MKTEFEKLPETGQIDFTIHVSTTMNYSADAAKRIVGRYVANEISYLLRAEEPSLIVAEKVFWRVPVSISLPDAGNLGSIGAIDVAVETGEFNLTPQQRQEIEENAEAKVARHSAASSPASNATTRG